MRKSLKNSCLAIAIVMLSCFSCMALAAVSGETSKGLGGVFSRLTSNLIPLRNVLSAASYIIGIAFALAGLMALKAHKDNPQANPLSKGLVSLLVGALLLFLPQIMDTASETLFGSSAKKGISTSDTDFAF